MAGPAAAVLGMRDSLQLDSGQVVLLTLLRDSLTRRNGVIMDSLRAIAEAVGRSADATMMMNLMLRLRPGVGPGQGPGPDGQRRPPN